MGTAPPDTDPLPYLYTSQEEMESCFSQVGISLRVNDDYSDIGPADIFDDVVEEATDEVNTYLAFRYFEEDLYKSRWVRRRCSWIGCYLLSQRRGNPKQMAARYQSVIAQLERCMNGEFNVPRLRWRATFLPDYSNLVVDSRYPNAPQKLSQANRGIGWWF